MFNVYEIWKGLILARETEFAILSVSPSQAAARGPRRRSPKNFLDITHLSITDPASETHRIRFLTFSAFHP